MNTILTKAKQKLARFLPSRDYIQHHRSLRWASRYLQDERLWQIQSSPVSRAMLVGLFCACIPLPMQMLLAASFAIALRANVCIAIGLVWVSNPLTIPPMLYGQYQLGRWLLHRPPLQIDHWSVSVVMQQLSQLFLPLLLGSVLVGATLGILGYLVSRLVFWLFSKKLRVRK